MNKEQQPPSSKFKKEVIEEEKGKEINLNQSLDLVSGEFFDNFISENQNYLNNPGILIQNLVAGINGLVGLALQEKGEDFSTKLERYLLDDLNNNYSFPDKVRKGVEEKLTKNLK
jgi:hypothetical protein